MYCRKGWSTRLWAELRRALLRNLALRLIPREKTVENFLMMMGGHGEERKPREGVSKVYATDNLVILPLRCDMVAILSAIS